MWHKPSLRRHGQLLAGLVEGRISPNFLCTVESEHQRAVTRGFLSPYRRGVSSLPLGAKFRIQRIATAASEEERQEYAKIDDRHLAASRAR